MSTDPIFSRHLGVLYHLILDAGEIKGGFEGLRLLKVTAIKCTHKSTHYILLCDQIKLKQEHLLTFKIILAN